MTFREAVTYLESFVNYEKRSAYAYQRSFKLERMRTFLSLLGNPQDAFKSVHIAGTKGKGSVSVFCASIMREAGYRTGLYTSPHLSDVRERIRVLEPGVRRAGDFEGMIPRDALCSLVARLRPAIDSFCASSPNGPLSFFEVYTALAFVHFKERRVECAVLETGMGGRLDATNVVIPAACCITAISFDHTDKLGRTLTAIAGEKAGIIKPCAGIVSAPQHRRVREVLEKKCRRAGVRLYTVGRDIRVSPACPGAASRQLDITGVFGDFRGLAINLCGDHQADNAACAVGLAVTAGQALPHAITAAHVRKGLARAVWPGRFEIVREGFVLDGAHNGASAKVLADAMRAYFPGKKVSVILGVSQEKDLPAICRQLLAISRRFIVTRANNPRAFASQEIKDCLRSLAPGAKVQCTSCVAEALRHADREEKGRVYCVTGSLFLVGEARDLLKGKIHA